MSPFTCHDKNYKGNIVTNNDIVSVIAVSVDAVPPVKVIITEKVDIVNLLPPGAAVAVMDLL